MNFQYQTFDKIHAKVHLCQQYQDLKQVGALTIEESSFNQLNLLNELTTKHKDMVTDLKQYINEQIKTNSQEEFVLTNYKDTDMMQRSLIILEVVTNFVDQFENDKQEKERTWLGPTYI